jgi:phage terminase large subunit-like protein
MFPNARNDDMCDAMSQAACWLLQHRFPTVRCFDVFTGEIHFEG